MKTAALASPRASSTPPNTLASTKKDLKSQDFIKMMITQLQHQDPMEPAKNQELMAQMAQIGQLQANSQLQDLLSSLTLQGQIGSAGNLIGKAVEGLDENNEPAKGLVTSVRVRENKVFLELDSGKTLPMGNITAVAQGPSAGTSIASKV
jgi:flagellar basal-body rod modification protein FlgD